MKDVILGRIRDEDGEVKKLIKFRITEDYIREQMFEFHDEQVKEMNTGIKNLIEKKEKGCEK